MTSDYRLDPNDERLFDGDQPIPLSNKAFQLLKLFVGNPDHLLTKDRILDEIWGEVHVSEGLIKEYVRDLRLALNDHPKTPRFIETVHGRGYRFLGGIRETDTRDLGLPPDQVAAPPVVAVVPFASLGGEKRWALFCTGLTDDLVIDLARYPDLSVIALGEAEHSEGNPAATARLAGAAFMLTGSVQTTNDRLRVDARLIETAGGTCIWAEQYDRMHGEFFDIQSGIVALVASAVGGFTGRIPRAERRRLDRKPLANLDVYEMYRMAVELELSFDRDNTLRAADLIERAVELDPGFARGWLVLGWLSWQIVLENWSDDLRKYRDLERVAFAKAATLDPLDPFALLELATVRSRDGDLTGARDALERAADLGRNQADFSITASTYFATLVGDQPRAEELLDRGRKLIHGMSPFQYLSAARVSFFGGDFAATAENARRGPDCMIARLLELLAVSQLDDSADVQELRRAFSTGFVHFRPDGFIKDLPITAEQPKKIFLESIDLALPTSAQSQLRVVR